MKPKKQGAGRPTFPEPEWKRFLSLGEQLLDQPDAVSQRELIKTTIIRQLRCQAEMWFCQPFYPLPNQPPVPVLPKARAPQIVRKAYETGQMACPDDSGPGGCAEPNHSRKLAVPVVTRDHILGVVLVERPDGPPFNLSELEFLNGLTSNAALTLEITRQVTIKNWRSEQLGLVRSVSAQIANVVDTDELCRRVTRLIRESFKYYYVGILTLSHDRQILEFRASSAVAGVEGPPPDFSVKIGEGIIGYVAETAMELLAVDVQQEPIYRHIDALPETKSEVVLPLKFENRMLGTLDVQSNQLDAFHETDMQVLRALANSISIAIEGNNLYRDLQRRNEQMSMLVDVTHTLNSILDLDTLLDEVVTLIQQRFGFTFVHIFTVHAGRQKIIYRAGSGERSQAMHDKLISYDLNDPTGIISWVARSGQLYYTNNVDMDPLYRASELPPANTRSEMSVPLTVADEVFGIMDIQSDRLNAFDPNHIAIFQALAASIAVAMRNATLYRSERWRRQVAESFREVSAKISANLELDALLEKILCELERNLPCDASAIWLLHDTVDGSQQIDLAAIHGLEAEKVNTIMREKPQARELLDKALTTTSPFIRKSGELIGPLGLALECDPDYSSIAAPLIAGDHPLGVLSLAHHTAGRYGSEARDMTSTFANYAAVAIQNARLFAEAQTQAWVSTVLLQVAESTRSIDNVEDLVSATVRITPLLVGMQKAAIFLWDETQQAFQLKSRYELDLPDDYPLFFDEHTTPAFARLRATQTAIYIEDAESELKFPEGVIESGEGTTVLMPLLAHGALLGAYMVVHQSGGLAGLEHPFDDQTLAILQGMAHQTTLALENLKLLEARQEEGYVTAVMLQVAQAVASQNRLEDILDTIIHLMPILVGIDACLIYLWDDASQEFYPAQVFTGSKDEEEMLLNRTYPAGEYDLLDRVLQNQAYFCPMGKADLPPDEWNSLYCLTQDEFQTVSPFTSSAWLMGFPLSVKGETYGVLIAKETKNTPAFRDRRTEILNGIAQQVALAIQNDRFDAELVERERMEREFQLAREIQRTFLPNRMPILKGWEVDARWQTARSVGGDFYDIFRLGKKRLGLVIADVSDKGMPAALYMTVTRTLIRANAQNHSSPASVLAHVNNQLAADAENGMFVTCVYAILELETGLLTYANAGHNLPLLYNCEVGGVKSLQKGNMALAVLEDNPYVDHVYQLNPGDTLLLYTDGVTENFSPDEEPFGEQRLEEVFMAICDLPVKSLLDNINSALTEFREGLAPSDDVTLLAIRRKPN